MEINLIQLVDSVLKRNVYNFTKISKHLGINWRYLNHFSRMFFLLIIINSLNRGKTV